MGAVFSGPLNIQPSTMKAHYCLLPALLIVSGCEPLVYRAEKHGLLDNGPRQAQTRQFLTKIALDRPSQPVQGIMHGEPVIADYTASETDDCGTLLITYQNLDHSETWNVCANGAVSRAAEGVPKLPSGSDFMAVRHAATQVAWLKGKSETVYADYAIFARDMGLPDDRGCATVENTVMWNGHLVDVRTEQICGAR